MCNRLLENHPAKTLISVFALGIATSWAICHFTINESERQMHEAEIRQKEAQVEALKSLCQQYESRIDFIESEKESLRKINDIYWGCISTDHELTIYMKNQLEKIVSAENDSKLIAIEDLLSPDDSMQNNVKNAENPIIEILVKVKDSYVSANPAIVIGVHSISISERAIVNITIDDQTIADGQEVTPGKTFDYNHNGENYRIIIKNINYVYGFVKVIVMRSKQGN